MPSPHERVVVGIDNGATKNNATILDASGRFLVDRMYEIPSRVAEGPASAIESMAETMELVLRETGIDRDRVVAVGLDTPGPASADGVISVKGATNFAQPAWWGFDVRAGLEERIGLPVVYNNDGNAAALYAHHVRSARPPRPARRCRPSSAPGWAAGSSRPATSCGARPAWPASSATCGSPRTASWPTTSRCRSAAAATPATSRASPRSPGSSATCFPTG